LFDVARAPDHNLATVRRRHGVVLIPRPRITEQLAARPIATLEAPGGYGKTIAWTDFAATLDVVTMRVAVQRSEDLSGLLSSIGAGARRAGLVTLADAIEPDDADASREHLIDRLAVGPPTLIAVEDVHRASREASAWLAEFANDLPRNVRLVIGGRRLDATLAEVANTANATILSDEDLRFTPDEVAAVLQRVGRAGSLAADVDTIMAMTRGWPAAVVVAAAGRAVGSRDTHRSATGVPATVLQHLVDDLLNEADTTTRELVGQIAGLPLLSKDVVEVVGGPGGLDRILDAGLPIRLRADGWAELAEPVRELFPRAEIGREAGRSIAALYAASGELVEAVTLLHRTGDHEGVIELLAGQRRETLVSSGLAFFEGALSAASDESLAAHPSVLVTLVQAAERQRRLQAIWADRAERVLPTDSAERRAIDAERVLEIGRGGDLEGALVLAESIIANARDSEIVTRARANGSHAVCLLVRDVTDDAGRAREELELAVGLFSLAGERDWEAEAHQQLGFGVYYPSGAFDRAVEQLNRALALRPAPDAARAGTLTYLAEVLMQLGRLDDAAVAIRESSAIGHRLGDSRSIAYAAWSAARLGAERRDRAETVTALETAESHPEGWFNDLAGVEFLANAAEYRAIVGDEAGARRDLARAEMRAAGTALEGSPLSARVRIETVFGDPAEALRQIELLDKSPQAYRGDRWLRLLYRAAALGRSGDRAGAAELVERSRQVSADLGDPERLARREPELLAIAVPDATPAEPIAEVTIALLSRFGVERAGVDVSPPRGAPATLVKLVALQGSVTMDEAIDTLWPDVDFDTGRARLRNVLNRLRSSSGDVVERHDGTIALAPGVSVDAPRFEEEATAALAARPEERVGLARRALARATGELLPGDRYADWTMVPRERIRRRHLALIDLVADDAIKRGDLDEAERLLDAAISTDPLEEERYVRLARALLAQGRVRRARRVAEQAVAVAEDLGGEPGDDLAALLERYASIER
jgi:DNA-binding SARP family transcriptional activator